MNMITGPKAIETIEREFPENRAELHDETWDGLLHLQISVFSRLAQASIDSGDRTIFKKVCDLFLEFFQNGEDALINALNVSFLEHLSFEDSNQIRSWAYHQMPNTMRMAYDAMEEYNRRLHGGR